MIRERRQSGRTAMRRSTAGRQALLTGVIIARLTDRNAFRRICTQNTKHKSSIPADFRRKTGQISKIANKFFEKITEKSRFGRFLVR